MSKTPNAKKNGLLMTANWDSNVGYAWWLMESYWVTLAERYCDSMEPILAYPSISKVPDAVARSPLVLKVEDFSKFSPVLLVRQVLFIIRHRVRVMYLSDRPTRHWAYGVFRLAGVRSIVVHDHTPGLRTVPAGLKRKVKAFLNRLPLINADICIGATDFVRERIINVACVPAAKCYAVPNGIPLALPAPRSIHEAFGLAPEVQVIVTAARANRYKGGFFALDVFAQVKERYGLQGWHYVFMGDGPHRDELKAAAERLGLADNVSFPGRVEGVTALFQSASLAFHPSQGEVGYSLSILEYMLAGLPVVVPDNPSVSGATVSGETGFIYPENDVSAAAAIVLECFRNPERSREIGAAAEASVRRDYSLSRAHERLREIFEERVLPGR